jgi:dimethylaniline monooxygenase (N-oxide forming)
MVPDNTRPARGGKIVTTGDDILGANPAIHSSLIENIKVGRITPHRASVGEITATGLSLTNGETIDNLDAIILCTGYDIDYPFISDNCYCSKHSKFMDSRNSVHLYRLTVPHVRNLFIMGVFQLPGPIQPAVELQARWVTAILTGRIMLPPAGRMSELIASEEEEGGRQVLFFPSPSKEGQIHITHGSPTVLIRSVDPLRPTHRLRPLPPIL